MRRPSISGGVPSDPRRARTRADRLLSGYDIAITGIDEIVRCASPGPIQTFEIRGERRHTTALVGCDRFLDLPRLKLAEETHLRRLCHRKKRGQKGQQ